MNYIFLPIIGFLAVFLLMPLNFYICRKLNLIDQPDHRKVHKDIKYRGGGISIYIAFFVFMTILYIIKQEEEILGIIISSLILFITGVIDDKFGMKARIKLAMQVVSAVVAFSFGVQIAKLNIYFDVVHLNIWISFFITVFWIILLINAVNLIDGLDGLASGVGIIILSSLIYFTLDDTTKVIAFFLIGTLLGFLKFNFYPSRIFLGDTGSMFLGFIIAVLSVIGVGKTVVGITTILLIVSFPILDVCLAIIRRLINRKPIFAPDKNHIHHSLMNKGLSHKNSVIMIYFINLMLVMSAVVSFYATTSILFLIVSWSMFILIAFILIKKLNLLPKKKEEDIEKSLQ